MTARSELPLVTIVTPSYNQGSFIEETIQSVLNQDYPNIEYLVIDGGSSDNTLEILRRYSDHLDWISEPDRGQSHAINKGFRKARGEIVAWLNSDDLYEKDAVRTAVDFLTSNPDIKLIYGKASYINQHSEVIGENAHSQNHDLWVLINEVDYMVQPTVFIRKEVMDVVGYLNEELKWAMDWEFWIRICSKFQAHFLNYNLAKLRIHRSTKTSNGGLLRFIETANLLNKYSSRISFLTYVRYGLNVITQYLYARAPIIYSFLSRIFNPMRTRLRCNIANQHGVYNDKWLGHRSRFLFPFNANATGVRFVFSFPPGMANRRGCVTARINGQIFGEFPLPLHDFFELTLPYDPAIPKPTEVELTFSRFLPPDEQGRKRACKLAEVKLVN